MLSALVSSLRRAPPLLRAWPRALSLLSQQRAYVSVTQARKKIFGWWEPEGAASTPFNGLNRLRRRGWIGEKVRFDLDARARPGQDGFPMVEARSTLQSSRLTHSRALVACSRLRAGG